MYLLNKVYAVYIEDIAGDKTIISDFMGKGRQTINKIRSKMRGVVNSAK